MLSAVGDGVSSGDLNADGDKAGSGLDRSKAVGDGVGKGDVEGVVDRQEGFSSTWGVDDAT